MALTIAQARCAAKMLRTMNMPVTLPNLRKVSGVNASEWNSILRVNGLREELGVVTTQKDFSAIYLAAANILREKGELVTIAALMSELDAKRGTVNVWLARHPEIASELGIVPWQEKERLKRVTRYKAAAAVLLRQGGAVTKRKIASFTGYDRTSVIRDFKKDTSLEALLKAEERVTESA